MPDPKPGAGDVLVRVLATGARYRRLHVENLDAFEASSVTVQRISRPFEGAGVAV
jgi:hypothetical protein